MTKDEDSVVLRFDGAVAKQLRDLKTILGVGSPGEVVMQALTLLHYSIGGNISIQKGKTVLKFDQFSDKQPLPENTN